MRRLRLFESVVLLLALFGTAIADSQTFHLAWPEHIPGHGPLQLAVTVQPGMKASLHDTTLDEANAVRVTEVTVEPIAKSKSPLFTDLTVRATRAGAKLTWECAMAPQCPLIVVDESVRPFDKDAAAAWCGPKQSLKKLIAAPSDPQRLRLARDLAASMLDALRAACRGDRCIAPVQELITELASSPLSLSTKYDIGAGQEVFDAMFAGRGFGIQCENNHCEARVSLAPNDAFIVRYVSDDDTDGRGCTAGTPRPALQVLGEVETSAHRGEIPGPLLALRGVSVPTAPRELVTPWPATLVCSPKEVTFGVDESDAQLRWRSRDGLDIAIDAKRDDHMGHGETKVKLPNAPERLQSLSIVSGHPTQITIGAECLPHESLYWTCEMTSPTCELRRIERAPRPNLPKWRAPFLEAYCVSPWDKVENQLVALSRATPAALAKQEGALRQMAAALLDEAHSDLEQQCPAHVCSDEAEAALPRTRDAATNVPKLALAAIAEGPAFELRRGNAVVATVYCQSYNCRVRVPLPDGTQYGYAAGLNSLGHAKCISDSGFLGPHGEDLGSRDDERGGVTGRYIRLFHP